MAPDPGRKDVLFEGTAAALGKNLGVIKPSIEHVVMALKNQKATTPSASALDTLPDQIQLDENKIGGRVSVGGGELKKKPEDVSF